MIGSCLHQLAVNIITIFNWQLRIMQFFYSLPTSELCARKTSSYSLFLRNEAIHQIDNEPLGDIEVVLGMLHLHQVLQEHFSSVIVISINANFIGGPRILLRCFLMLR